MGFWEMVYLGGASAGAGVVVAVAYVLGDTWFSARRSRRSKGKGDA